MLTFSHRKFIWCQIFVIEYLGFIFFLLHSKLVSSLLLTLSLEFFFDRIFDISCMNIISLLQGSCSNVNLLDKTSSWPLLDPFTRLITSSFGLNLESPSFVISWCVIFVFRFYLFFSYIFLGFLVLIKNVTHQFVMVYFVNS